LCHYFNDWPIYLSICIILCIFSHSTHFLNVVTITCIYKNLYFNYIFIICELLLSDCCKLYCTVLHSVILVSCLMYLLCHSLFCDVLILTCFIRNCHLTDVGFVKRIYVRACVCVCVCFFLYASHSVLYEVCTVGKEKVEHSAALHHQMVALCSCS